MFDEDLTQLSTVDLLESAAEHRALAARADARSLEHAVIYADRFHPDACTPRPGRRSFEGRERAVILGGDGTPPIVEFAIAEYAVVTGISHGVAARYLGEALALRHRFPFTWARILSGDATPWKACRIARECMKLSEEAARYVDGRIADLIDTITPYRLDKIVKAAKMHADPDLAHAEAAAKVRERGVFIGRSDEHGTKTIYIRTSSGAASRFDSAINALGKALQTIGDPRSPQFRRAEAVGIIGDHAFAEELLAQAQNGQHSSPVTPQSSSHAPAPVPTSDTEAAELRPVGAEPARRDESSADDWAYLDEDLVPDEPGLDDEADRDAPHPSSSNLPDSLGTHRSSDGVRPEDGDSVPMDRAAYLALVRRLAQIKRGAYARLASNAPPGTQARPGKTEIYVHLTDQTLQAAVGSGADARPRDGVVRAEGIGPLLISQLNELIGYGPYTVKPVIDLNNAISVNCYEATDRIRERVKLAHPVELFPFGTRETIRSLDLDHVVPYDPLGPPGQTSTTNLAPLGRFAHRVKTHARGWQVHRITPTTLEWTTPHGFVFQVDPTGTHRIIRSIRRDR